MKKNLLAIAVGAAVAFPGLALADGPTVYGKVNVSLENSDVDDGTTSEDTWELNSNASRLGVKGDFDLDVANLKAIYQAEFEISVDDGDKSGQTFSQRNIYGGLEGSFGTIKAGKFDTPTKKAQGKIDQFNDIGGDIKNVLAGENRVSNIIQYSTPKLADMITLNLAFIPAEGDDVDADGEADTDIADTTSISLVAEKDMFYGAISRDTDMSDELIADSTGIESLDITRVAAGLKPGNFELGALYQMAEETEGEGEDTSIVVSAAMKIDRVKLKAQYGMTDGDQSDEEVTQVSLGADYKLASASKVYVYGTQLEFDLADEEETIIGLGMEHKF
ncbi:porin [Alcanivorax sp. HI0033]|uniref:porin n=1 Tax=unclassified Alcanivorax TaxID=2638842 RepID=UPI0007B9D866|nr:MULTISPECIES: porin [unclassified Alcanivorax]KZX77577.1 porin [Alcanivorax sp. HI0013]KZX84363.1 porin [Alcanivorax sp. HI0011]KZY19969.1 porin [Alcanivorax sp. HI0035]KZX66275.1 porin [Alcanivorax sp. HI0007]KZX70758.1 porin [Alcanivorax sp. HI0003]